MSIDELIDRLRYRFNDYWNSEKRSIKLISRALAFTLFAAVISTVAPTLADELSSDPQMLEPVAPVTESTTVTTETITESPTPAPSPTASATPSPTPSVSRPAIAQPSESPLPEGSESATAEAEPAPLEIQPRYIIKVPASIAVDPRAGQVFAPHLYASVDLTKAPYTMICVSGTSGTRFDALQKGVANESAGGDLIAGDRTGVLLISSDTNRAINILNSYQGLFLTTWGGGVSGRSFTYSFVAVTKPVVDPAFCAASRSTASSSVRSLAIDLSTVKGGGNLK